MADGGFIKIHRRILDSPVMQAMTASQRSVWIQMLLEANWRPTEVLVKEGRAVVHRGEFITGQEALAAKAGVSRKVVRQAYATLLRDGAITQRILGTGLGPSRGRRVFAVTITNYSRFQDKPVEEGHRGAKEGPDQKKGKKGRTSFSPDRPPSTPSSPPIDEGNGAAQEPEQIVDMAEWHRRRDAYLTAKYGEH